MTTLKQNIVSQCHPDPDAVVMPNDVQMPDHFMTMQSVSYYEIADNK